MLKLNKDISETTDDIDADDVLNTKKQLKSLGYYQEPDWGITKFSDNQLFEGIRKFQQDKGLKVDGIMKPAGETETAINKILVEQNAVSQVTGAISDLYKNYKDMKKDKTIGADDYFHCKANYEATQRGKFWEKTAEYFGNAKEKFDYFRNRIKGISAINAYADYLHDKDINTQGRQQAKNGLYNSSKAGCNYKRVRGINEKY